METFGSIIISYQWKSGLRPVIVDRIKGLALKRGKEKAVMYFIGDSLIRNQALALCAILTNGYVKPKDVNNWSSDHVCESPSANLYFKWAATFNPYAVVTIETILKQSNNPLGRKRQWGKPDLIYFDGNLHMAYKYENSVDQKYNSTRYGTGAKTLLQSYIGDAPDAQINVFLSHAVCNEKHPIPTRINIKERNDILLTQTQDIQTSHQNVKIVDGYKFTENLGCDATDDGVHWDRYIFQELVEMLDA